MKLIDTHAHLYVHQFDEDRDEVLGRMTENGIDHVVLPNIDRNSWEAAEQLEASRPDQCHLAIGLHPCSVKEGYQDELVFFEDRLRDRSYAAIGETGIDLYWDKTTIIEQRDAFDQQIIWSRDLGIPLIIHSRDSLDLTIEMVTERQDGRIIPIFHCFTGSVKQAKKIQDIGGYMGIGGVISYKNSGLKPIISQIPLKSLVLETDSPYLPPTPHRGKRNEPSFLMLIARHLADAVGAPIEEVAKYTTENAHEIFGNYLKDSSL